MNVPASGAAIPVSHAATPAPPAAGDLAGEPAPASEAASAPDQPAPGPAAGNLADEPVTISEAARRCGVHPNTVRRLVHRGTLGALMVKTRYGKTWLVSEAELRQVLAQPRHRPPAAGPVASGAPADAGEAPREDTGGGTLRRGAAAPAPAPAAAARPATGPAAAAPSGPVAPSRLTAADTGTGAPASAAAAPPDVGRAAAGHALAWPATEPAAPEDATPSQRQAAPVEDERPAVEPLVAATVDLSLDRATALERYTHSLLEPLVNLLREREAALERREAVVRHQAERIGRLEREVELLRAQLQRRARATPLGDRQPADGDGAYAYEVDGGASGQGAISQPQDEEMVALSAQVQRLRGELRLMSERLEQHGQTLARAADAPSEPPAASAAPPDLTPVQGPALGPPGLHPPLDAGPNLTPYPPLHAWRGGAEGRGEVGATAAPPAAKGEMSDAERFWARAVAQAVPPAERSPIPRPDPFAEAEQAIRELQQALAAQSDRGRPAAPEHDDAEVPEDEGEAEGVVEEQAPRRRPWWKFW